MLAWLLEEETCDPARELLREARLVLTSDLTLVECHRVLIRAAADGRIAESAAANRQAHLRQAAGGWTLLRVGEEVVDRARRSFPAEPLGTSGALHLASALLAAGAVGDLRLLSLDESARANGRELGFEVLPVDETERT